MRIDIDDKIIRLEKETNLVDDFVIEITKILDKYFDYVIVSGYLSILFGKVRGTEDIDVFVRKIEYPSFKKFWDAVLKNGYEILNSKSPEDAYDMLKQKLAIRISKKGEFIPNIELKFPEDNWGIKSLKERIKVLLNGNEFFISSIEMNIAFKLYLGSRKDLDDAFHLYLLFKKLDHLDMDKTTQICSQLGVDSKILEKC